MFRSDFVNDLRESEVSQVRVMDIVRNVNAEKLNLCLFAPLPVYIWRTFSGKVETQAFVKNNSIDCNISERATICDSLLHHQRLIGSLEEGILYQIPGLSGFNPSGFGTFVVDEEFLNLTKIAGSLVSLAYEVTKSPFDHVLRSCHSRFRPRKFRSRRVHGACDWSYIQS